MAYQVVYWPRHLWTPTAFPSSSAVVCLRLSPHALCVVSLDATSATGLELLPAKGSESRRIVLFDVQVAVRGSFETLHAPHHLQQIKTFFTRAYNGEPLAAAVAQESAMERALEAVGYYIIYVPFAALLTLTTAFQHLLHTTKTPSWLLAGGGKRVADLSTFLSVLSQQLHNAASIPVRIRQYYRITKTRRLARQERLALLQVGNLMCFLLLDMLLGRVVLAYVVASPHLQALLNSPNVVVELLRTNVEWLMGAPAGFKLNKPMASILGNSILLWLHLWSFLFEHFMAVAKSIPLSWWLLRAIQWMGMTLQLTCLAGVVNLMTWHSHWVYLYFAKLNRLQFGLFSSLSKLFLGKKNNVLRHRVDTCEYDVGQLLLGTLFFTVLTFLVTTNLVFFVFFAAVHGGIEMILVLLWLPVVLLTSLPLASLVYRAWNPTFFIVGMEVRTCEGPAGTHTVIEHVGVGRQSPLLDAQHRIALRQVFASWEDSNKVTGTDAIFQLVPITSSYSAQFTRLRRYFQAVGARYSLAVIVRACLFGTTEVAQVPLSVLLSFSE